MNYGLQVERKQLSENTFFNVKKLIRIIEFFKHGYKFMSMYKIEVVLFVYYITNCHMLSHGEDPM